MLVPSCSNCKSMNAPEKIYFGYWISFNNNLQCTYYPDKEDDICYIREDLVPQWLPIEQAPTVGTPVDLWTSIGRTTDCTLEWEQGWPREHYWKDSRGNFVDNPTHWMPIPKPPEVKK